MELSEDEAAQRVAEAAQHGFPGDQNAQVRNVANAARLLGVGVTLKALAIIAQRCRGRDGQVEMEAYVPPGQRENARAHALAVGIGYAYPPVVVDK